MDIILDTASGLVIRAYEPGKITINDTDYQQNLMITPTEIVTDLSSFDVKTFTLTDCERITALQPEVVLFGTGTQIIFPTAEILAYFGQRRIGCETMGTAAACRTYNVLLAEDRKVIAVLVI